MGCLRGKSPCQICLTALCGFFCEVDENARLRGLARPIRQPGLTALPRGALAARAGTPDRHKLGAPPFSFCSRLRKPGRSTRKSRSSSIEKVDQRREGLMARVSLVYSHSVPTLF